MADTVILKDGSPPVEGTITEVGSNSLTILCPLSKGSKSKGDREFKMSDIETWKKDEPDQKEFQDLGSLETPATVTDTVSFYDPMIDKLTKFIEKYPDSSFNPQACERLKTLKDEQTKVSAGDCRLDGVWITASERATEPYQTGALIKYTQIKAAAASNNPVMALKGYELLEKNYPGSAVMPDAVTSALQQLQQLQQKLNAAKASVDNKLKNFSNSVAALEKTRADEAKIMKDDLVRRENNAKASIATATADGSKFFAVCETSKESLNALQTLILAEQARLNQFSLSTMREGIAAAKEGLRMIKAEKIKEARDQLALSQKLWPANYDNTKLKTQADQFEATIAEKAKIAATEAAKKAEDEKARKLAVEKAAQEAAEKAKKEAAELAAKQAAEKAAQEAAQKAALEAAKGAAGLVTPTPTPSVVDKLNDNREIINVLSK